MYKTVLEVLTYILQHFRQTFTVCEIDFYNFSCRSERDTSALVGVSLSVVSFTSTKIKKPILSLRRSHPSENFFFILGEFFREKVQNLS